MQIAGTGRFGGEYETVAASQTAQKLGVSGALMNYLNALVIVPATTSPGIVSIGDGDNTHITVFAGGATSVASLAPIVVPLGIRAVDGQTPGWSVTTGANVSVIAIGDFT